MKDKTLVGIVYKLDEMWQGDNEAEPTIFTGYNKPTESFKETRKLVGYQISVDAKENIPFKSESGFINAGSSVWGLYPSSDTNGHGSIQSEISAATGISSIFDLPGIVNITTRGLTGGPNNDYQTIGNYLDINEDDGFKDYSEASGCVVDWQGKQKHKRLYAMRIKSLTHICFQMIMSRWAFILPMMMVMSISYLVFQLQ